MLPRPDPCSQGSLRCASIDDFSRVASTCVLLYRCFALLLVSRLLHKMSGRRSSFGFASWRCPFIDCFGDPGSYTMRYCHWTRSHHAVPIRRFPVASNDLEIVPKELRRADWWFRALGYQPCVGCDVCAVAPGIHSLPSPAHYLLPGHRGLPETTSSTPRPQRSGSTGRGRGMRPNHLLSPPVNSGNVAMGQVKPPLLDQEALLRSFGTPEVPVVATRPPLSCLRHVTGPSVLMYLIRPPGHLQPPLPLRSRASAGISPLRTRVRRLADRLGLRLPLWLRPLLSRDVWTPSTLRPFSGRF